MIPRIIHRIWLDDPMPPTFASFGDRWRELHPGWAVQEWVDSSALLGMQNEVYFADAQKWYPKDWKRYQADLLRLELLNKYGGVYVDTDIEPFHNIGSLIEGESCLVGRSPQKGHPITNAFMASKPGHPFIQACLDEVPNSTQRYHQRHLARCVGPWMLTRVYEAGDFSMTIQDDLYDGELFTHHWNNAKRKKGKGLG